MRGIRKGIWVARDENGSLYAYTSKPKKCKDYITQLGDFRCNATCEVMELPSSWYKNVKFKNSPVFVPLTEDFVKQFIKN